MSILLFVAKAREKNIELLFFIDTNLPKTIIGDSLKIKQVISNLVQGILIFHYYLKVSVQL
jgi:signal transduction histidine kinase